MISLAKTMSRFSPLPLAMCLCSNVLYAQIDNTIDLSGQQTPPPINTNRTFSIEDSKQDTKPQTTQQTTPTTPTRTTQKDVEIGIGYLYSSFSAKQSFAGLKEDSRSQSHGIEIFVNSNWYLRKNVGVTLGCNMEYLPSFAWSNTLIEYGFTNIGGQAMPFEENNNDSLLVIALSLGGFYDTPLLKSQKLRAFANIGLGLNYLFGGLYDGDITASGLMEINLINIPPITLPITLGARYVFATHHSIEAVFKYNPLSLDYRLNWTPSLFSETLSLETKITRPLSFGLRYVYEFK